MALCLIFKTSHFQPVVSRVTMGSYPAAFYPGTALVAAAQTIKLDAGQTRDGVDVSLRPVPTVRVSGRIVGSDARSVAGMVLRLIAPGMEDLAEGSEVATTLVTPDGKFTFLNVPSGDYTLVASRASVEYRTREAFSGSADLPGTPGSVPGPGSLFSSLTSGPPGSSVYGRHEAGDVNTWARMPLPVGAADVVDVAVQLRRGSTMRGRIAWEGDGAPPGPTAIAAEPADGSTWLGMPQTAGRASFDDDDRFTINGFLPGEYVLRVIGLGPPQAVKSIMIGGRDYATRPIDATGGQDFDNVVVTYTDRLASIGGTVTTRADDPPITVIAFPMERDAWSKYGLTPTRFQTAGLSNSGLYKIANIPAGRYLLVAVPTEQQSRWQDPAFLAESLRHVPAALLILGEGHRVRQHRLSGPQFHLQPRIMLEGRNCILPLIGSRRHADSRRSLLDGVHGVYYDVEPGGLERAAVAALADKDRLKQMAVAARDHVFAHHTRRAYCERVLRMALE